jgi:tetratricopeptide (TPR) repeat protein
MAVRLPSPEAEAQLRAAVQGAERLGRFNHRRLEALEALADYYTGAGRLIEAEPLRVQIISLREKIYGPEHPVLAAALFEVSRAYQAMGRLEQALAVLALARQIHERDAVQNSALVAQDLIRQGELEALRGRPAEAEALLTRAGKILKILHGEQSPEITRWRIARGDIQLACGRLNEAQKDFEAARALVNKPSGPPGPEMADLLVRLARLAEARGQTPEACRLLKQALPLHERLGEAGERSAAEDRLRLARVELALGRARAARSELDRVLSAWSRALGPDHPEVARALAVQGEILGAEKRWEAAEAAYQRAWVILEKCHGSDSPALLRVMGGLAGLYFERACFEEADRLLNQLAKTAERVYGPAHPETRSALENLAVSLETQDRAEEAAALRRGIASRPRP